MPSAVIPSAHSYAALRLAPQLLHQRCVHPGPLVLGTNPLNSPTPTADRDRQGCYQSSHEPWARSFLPDSACRHAARTVSSRSHHSPCSAYSLGGFWIATNDVLPAHIAKACFSVHRQRIVEKLGE